LKIFGNFPYISQKELVTNCQKEDARNKDKEIFVLFGFFTYLSILLKVKYPLIKDKSGKYYQYCGEYIKCGLFLFGYDIVY